MSAVAGLTAPPPPGGRLGRLAFDVGRLGGGGAGGGRRVLIDPGFEGGDPLLEGPDQGEDGLLDIGGRPGPEVVRQWRLAFNPSGVIGRAPGRKSLLFVIGYYRSNGPAESCYRLG